MTKEEILAMQAGRELDALVADKVMGWEIKNNFFIGAERHLAYNTHDGNLIRCPHWTPSEDISLAWVVLEKRGKDYYVKRDEQNNRYEVVIDYVVFNEGDARPSRSFRKGYGATAPEAICKAALLASMEERT